MNRNRSRLDLLHNTVMLTTDELILTIALGKNPGKLVRLVMKCCDL